MSERLALETIVHCCLSSIIPITHSNTHNFYISHLRCDADHIARAKPKQVCVVVCDLSIGVNAGSKFAGLLGT